MSERLQPLWATFALLREQVERLVALNLFWAAQLLPGVVGLASGALPLLLRTALVGVSALLVVPASLAVYTVIAEAVSGSEITFADIQRAFRRGIPASFRSLAPLMALLAGLFWANLSLPGPLVLLVLLRLLLLFVLVCSLFWGPLLVENPARSAWTLLRASLELVFRYPARTLGAALVSLLMLTVATVSVGGLVLVVFVLLATYQTLLFRTLKG